MSPCEFEQTCDQIGVPAPSSWGQVTPIVPQEIECEQFSAAEWAEQFWASQQTAR